MEAALPEQIQRQLDQAAAIEADLYPNTETLASENTPVVEDEAAPVVPQAEQPVEDVAQPQVTPPAPADELWEQKFNVLRGKYEAEVPRLHAQIRELTEQIQVLMRRQETPADPPPPEPKLVTPADEEAFGTDLVDMVRRTAQEIVTKATKEIDKKVDNAVKPVADKVAQNAVEQFWGAVDTAVPDFNTVNQDPRWIQYLSVRIPGTQITRRDAAQRAIDGNDASSLVELVNDWKTSVAAAPTPQVTAPAATHKSLESQVAPSSRQDTAPSKPAGRIWSGEEYEAALDPRNAHRMPKADYEKLVADAEQALAENRIKW